MPRPTEAELKRAVLSASTRHAKADAEHRLAAFLQPTGRAAECEEHARKAIDLEDRPPLLGNHLMFLAQHLWQLRRFAEALPFIERALPMYAEGLGEKNSETRYMYSCAEMVCRELGDLERAERYRHLARDP